MDSSALIKRYHKEKGTNQVDILFDTLMIRKPKCMVTSDKRLLKVSKEEGFEILDTEEVEPGTVRELIGNYT